MKYIYKLLCISLFLLLSCEDTNGNGGEKKDTTAPGKITNLSATSGEASTLLKWVNPSDKDIKLFTVYFKSGTSDFTKATHVQSGSIDSARVSSLTNGTEYTFKVTLTDSSGNESAFSDEVTSTPKEIDKTAPGVATNLKYKSGNTTVTLLWDKPSDSDLKSISIYFKTGNDTEFTELGSSQTSNATLDSATVTGLVNYVNYAFKVKFTDLVGNVGNASAVLIATPENYTADFAGYWSDIKTGSNLASTISGLKSLLESSAITSDSNKVSAVKDALGWSYYMSGNGNAEDSAYTVAFNYFSGSLETDSKAGIAILGHLLDKWQLSLQSAKDIMGIANYAHAHLTSITRFKALLNGAWSAYLLDDKDSCVSILNDIDPDNANNTDLYDRLKRLK